MVSSNQLDPVSRTDNYKRVMKPMLERKRRARINKCLDDLREILVSVLQNDGEGITRLEKADILELTVNHVRKLSDRKMLAIPSVSAKVTEERENAEKFHQGFIAANNLVQRFLFDSKLLPNNSHAKLNDHLVKCQKNIGQPLQPSPTLSPPIIQIQRPVPILPHSSSGSIYPPIQSNVHSATAPINSAKTFHINKFKSASIVRNHPYALPKRSLSTPDGASVSPPNQANVNFRPLPNNCSPSFIQVSRDSSFNHPPSSYNIPASVRVSDAIERPVVPSTPFIDIISTDDDEKPAPVSSHLFNSTETELNIICKPEPTSGRVDTKPPIQISSSDYSKKLIDFDLMNYCNVYQSRQYPYNSGNVTPFPEDLSIKCIKTEGHR